MPRVAITGLGAISSIGANVPDFWDSIRNGRCGIRPIAGAENLSLRFQNGAQVPDYDSLKHFDIRAIDFMDRFAQFAVVSAREAVRDAQIDWTPALRAEAAVVTGSCVGGQSTEDQGFLDLYKRGRSRVHPLTIPRTMPNAGASHITMEFGITGPAFTVSTACSSAGHALGLAYWMIRSGAAPIVIAGGSEAPFSFGILKAWEAMRVISQTTCRPFSRNRSGMILGEGGAMLVLEDFDLARARGARIYAEVVGFGMSSDATHITQPCADGAAAAMQRALSDARIPPTAIGYINARGTGTEINDSTECKAIRTVYNSHAEKLLVSSTKSMHGHTLGAAAALEAVSTVLTLYHGIVAPTANFEEADPQCDLDVVPNHARPIGSLEYCMSNSFAFGGLNACIVIRRADE